MRKNKDTEREWIKFSVCFDIVLWQLGHFYSACMAHIFRKSLRNSKLNNFMLPNGVHNLCVCVFCDIFFGFVFFLFTTKNSNDFDKSMEKAFSRLVALFADWTRLTRVLVIPQLCLKCTQTHFIHFKHTTYPNMQTYILFVNKFNVCCFPMQFVCYITPLCFGFDTTTSDRMQVIFGKCML